MIFFLINAMLMYFVIDNIDGSNRTYPPIEIVHYKIRQGNKLLNMING